VQQAAAGFRGHVVEEKPRIVKDEVPFMLLSPVGKSASRALAPAM